LTLPVTLDSGWEALLTGTVVRLVEVYELELAAGTLRYANQSDSWGGNAYTRLAVRRAPIVEYMDPGRAPNCRVTFTNVSNTLRGQLEPADLLTGQRLTIRWLLRDSGGVLDPGSLIVHTGIMQRPRRIDQQSFEVVTQGLVHGTPTPVPGRRYGRTCEWAFGDATDCLYTSTTDATNNGSSSTALTVTSGTNLEDGEEITIGSGEAVAIASGGGTTNITLAAARTWSISDLVVLVNCSHEFPNCSKRQQTHLYGGFRGIEDRASAARLFAESVVYGRRWDFSNQNFMDQIREFFNLGEGEVENLAGRYGPFPEDGPLADVTNVVPIVYGRRLVSGKLLEELGVKYSTRNPNMLASVFGLGVGPIEDVVDFYDDDGRGEEAIDTEKFRGYWWRPGTIGLDASEVEADYLGGATPQERDQNRDYFSGTQDPLSRTAYATFIQTTKDLAVPDTPAFDVKGLKIDATIDPLNATVTPVVWLRAEDLAGTFNDGEAVTAWTDKITANDMTQAGAKLEAVFKEDDGPNGKGYLSNLNNARTLAFAAPVDVATDWTAITIYKSTLNAQAHHLWGNDPNAVGDDRGVTAVAYDGVSRSCQVCYNGSCSNPWDNVTTSQEWNIVAMRRGTPADASDLGHYMWFNGTDYTKSTPGTAGSGQSLRFQGIFYTDSSSWAPNFTGIAEVIIFPSALTEGEIAAIVRWYANYYDITLAVGSAEVWSRNPIYQARDLLVQNYGMGRSITTADLDEDAIDTAAAVAAAELTGEAATVVSTADDAVSGEYTVWTVDDTSQFARGMTVVHDDGSTETRGEVVNVWSSTELRLTIDDQTAASPDTLTPLLPRYTCDIVLDAKQTAFRSVAEILRTCGGYITYPDGKIALHVEAPGGSSVATFKDASPAAGYGMLQDSFRWIGDAGVDTDINQVIVTWTDQDNERHQEPVNDWDHRATNVLKSVTLKLDGVDNRHQAYRRGKAILDRARTVSTGAEFVAGPIGVKVLPGDLITLDHAVPNWTGEVKRVIKREIYGLGDQKDGLVKLVCADYDATLPADDGPPSTTRDRPGLSSPVLTLTVDSQAEKIKLTWSYTGKQALRHYSVFKSDATMNNAPVANGDKIASKISKTSLVYEPSDDEYGELLYFQVRARVGYAMNANTRLSNEVTAIVGVSDPTDTENEQGMNEIRGGDFNTGDESFWDTTAPSTTTFDADTNDGGGDYSNPADAYDNDSDFASAVVTTTPPGDEHWWGSSDGTSRDFRVNILHSVDKSSSTFPALTKQQLRFSTDGGSTYKKVTNSFLNKRTASTRWFLSTAPSSVRIYARTINYLGLGSVTGKVWNITYEYIDAAGAFSTVSGGEGHVRGNGTDTYGELAQVYGDPDVSIPSGLIRTWQIDARAPSLPGHDLEIALYVSDSDTHETLGVIAAADIPTDGTMASFAGAWIAPSDLDGPFEVKIRTLSTTTISVDHFQWELGQQLHAYSLNKEETGTVDYRNGVRQGYGRGGWDFSGGNDYSATKSGVLS
jgi:hypothetical protein